MVRDNGTSVLNPIVNIVGSQESYKFKQRTSRSLQEITIYNQTVQIKVQLSVGYFMKQKE